ncbi:DUF4190 domain-containing protein [Microbacterium sp. NPDC089189]|uniref:DUF4190 domain-containing protein n=1 Tax=Microbacterium sp. NPDC089189 TaxID=3154972 RepID=UPI00344805F4
MSEQDGIRGIPSPPPVDPDDPAAQPLLAAAAAWEDSRRADDAPAGDAPPPVPVPVFPVVARLEAPSPDVVVPTDESALPGAHRGGFSRAPTAPIEIGAQVEGPQEFVPTTRTVVVPDDAAPPMSLAVLSIGFAVVGLIVSFVVGWGFPLGIVAVVLGVLSLRRLVESRPLAVWGIVLGVLSLVYSGGWLVWAAYRSGMLG